MKWLGAFAAVAAVAAVGCGGSSSNTAPPPASQAELTYYHDIKPIVDARCTGCHVQGGLAPFPLVSVNDVVSHAALMREYTAQKLMPPWLAAPGCQSYQGDPSLTGQEIATIGQWADSGAAAGEPSNAGAPLAVDATGLSRVDSTIGMSGPYTPQLSPDDYHCFLVDWPETTTKYVTGFRARAGDAAIVHHVIAFLVPPSGVAEYEQMNASGNGWTCFGGPGGSQTGAGAASWIGAWAPGNAGGDFPDGTGIQVTAGSKIVLQVHYNSLNGTGTDQTSLDFKLDDSVAKQAAIIPYTNPTWLQSGGMTIPAGDPDMHYWWSFDVSPYMSLITGGIIGNSGFTIYASALHMHLLGTIIQSSITPASGGNDECLLDIEQWNFHWQRMYTYAEPLAYKPGDRLNLTCHWNNSQANQPTVNGMQQTARNVSWGEGTTDEMCLGLMYVTSP